MVANDDGSLSLNLEGMLTPAEVVFSLESLKLMLLTGQSNLKRQIGKTIPGLNPRSA